MKTADQYLHALASASSVELDDWRLIDVEYIKAIQLDAFKAGMTEAATMCENAAHIAQNPLHTDLQIYWKTYKRLQKDVTNVILTARDNKTSI